MRKSTLVLILSAVLVCAAGVAVFLLGGSLLGSLYHRLGLQPEMTLLLEVQVQDAIEEQAELAPIPPAQRKAIEDAAAAQTLAAIRARLSALGLAAVANPAGESGRRIAVLLYSRPDDPARLQALLTTRSYLQVAPVLDGPFSSQEAALAKHGGMLPPGARLHRAAVQGEWYLLKRPAVLTSRDLRNARPARSEYSGWDVDFTLLPEAAQRFGKYTEANIGGRLAIVLDDKVVSAPTIQSRIEDSGRITGGRSEQEASDLALVLRSGSLPAGVRVVEAK